MDFHPKYFLPLKTVSVKGTRNQRVLNAAMSLILQHFVQQNSSLFPSVALTVDIRERAEREEYV